MKKQLNGLEKLFGFSIIGTIVFGVILANYNLSLESKQEQLTKQIASLSKNQVKSEQIENLEERTNSVTQEILILSQQVETLQDSIPQNYDRDRNSETQNLGDEEYTAREYPANFPTTYHNECMVQAKEHLSEGDAGKICVCTLKRFQVLYSYPEYQKLSKEEKNDVGLHCANEVLSSEEKE